MKRKTESRNTVRPLLALFMSSVFLLIASCGNSYVPKPKGFFRIDLPVKKYVLFDSTYPFSFEYPQYSLVIPDTLKSAEPYWLNLYFPFFNGQVNVSYKKVENNLSKYTEDAYSLAMKHIPKASNIDEQKISYPENNVYGIIYDIAGTGAASPYQFYVTDSTTNFMRGALYFNIIPNNDSLAPVIDFLKTDILHMIETLKWKKV
jgi:gliding motility-associated lipoprotein GldD